MTSRHRGVLKDCFGETPKAARETRALPNRRVARWLLFGLLQGRAKIFGRIFAELFFERRDGRKLGGIKTR
jgi:hypothetical protein